MMYIYYMGGYFGVMGGGGDFVEILVGSLVVVWGGDFVEILGGSLVVIDEFVLFVVIVGVVVLKVVEGNVVVVIVVVWVDVSVFRG